MVLEELYSLTEWELLAVGKLENIFTCIPGVLHFFFNKWSQMPFSYVISKTLLLPLRI